MRITFFTLLALLSVVSTQGCGTGKGSKEIPSKRSKILFCKAGIDIKGEIEWGAQFILSEVPASTNFSNGHTATFSLTNGLLNKHWLRKHGSTMGNTSFSMSGNYTKIAVGGVSSELYPEDSGKLWLQVSTQKL